MGYQDALTFDSKFENSNDYSLQENMAQTTFISLTISTRILFQFMSYLIYAFSIIEKKYVRYYLTIGTTISLAIAWRSYFVAFKYYPVKYLILFCLITPGIYLLIFVLIRLIQLIGEEKQSLANNVMQYNLDKKYKSQS